MESAPRVTFTVMPYLTARSLSLEVLLAHSVDKSYRFFVHIREGADGTILKLYDYYPIIPTSEMEPGTVYRNLTFS